MQEERGEDIQLPTDPHPPLAVSKKNMMSKNSLQSNKADTQKESYIKKKKQELTAVLYHYTHCHPCLFTDISNKAYRVTNNVSRPQLNH